MSRKRKRRGAPYRPRVAVVQGPPATGEELFDRVVEMELARADQIATEAVLSGVTALAHSIAAAAEGEHHEAIEAAADGLRAIAAGAKLRAGVTAVRAVSRLARPASDRA